MCVRLASTHPHVWMSEYNYVWLLLPLGLWVPALTYWAILPALTFKELSVTVFVLRQGLTLYRWLACNSIFRQLAAERSAYLHLWALGWDYGACHTMGSVYPALKKKRKREEPQNKSSVVIPRLRASDIEQYLLLGKRTFHWTFFCECVVSSSRVYGEGRWSAFFWEEEWMS